jgi:hypothetical protein
MDNGQKVKVIDDTGAVCAIGTYHGTGIPGRELKAARPNLQHFAVLVEGEMRYYPTGYHTLIAAR